MAVTYGAGTPNWYPRNIIRLIGNQRIDGPWNGGEG
jgi:hypothetical protein